MQLPSQYQTVVDRFAAACQGDERVVATFPRLRRRAFRISLHNETGSPRREGSRFPMSWQACQVTC